MAPPAPPAPPVQPLQPHQLPLPPPPYARSEEVVIPVKPLSVIVPAASPALPLQLPHGCPPPAPDRSIYPVVRVPAVEEKLKLDGIDAYCLEILPVVKLPVAVNERFIRLGTRVLT